MSCSSITSLCINEEGIIFLGYSDGTLGVTMKKEEEIKIVGSSSSSILHLQTYDNKIISSNKKGCIEVWNVQEMTKEQTIQVTKNPIMDFDIYDENIYFATHCSNSPIYSYDLKSGELVKRSDEKRKHVKSVKVIISEVPTLLVGYNKGLELFNMDLNPICMVHVEDGNGCCHSPIIQKVKYICVSEPNDIIGVVMKRKGKKEWYLYEIDVNSMLVLSKRPLSTKQNKKIHWGREINNLSVFDNQWIVSLSNGSYIMEMIMPNHSHFIASSSESPVTYSILQKNQIISGYKDGSYSIDEINKSSCIITKQD